MATTLSTSYAATKARAKKVITLFEHAEAHLMDKFYAAGEDNVSYAEETALVAAQDVFKKLSALLNADVDAARTREGVGDYVPYGRPSPRRW